MTLYDEIKRFYLSDQQLLNTYHVLAPCDLETAVNHTVNLIEKCHDLGGYTHVCEEYYFTIYKNLLFAFFILRGYRHSHSQEFWDAVLDEGVNIACIWEKNIRARLFFERNSFKFVERKFDEDENQFYLIFELCQQEEDSH